MNELMSKGLADRYVLNDFLNWENDSICLMFSGNSFHFLGAYTLKLLFANFLL